MNYQWKTLANVFSFVNILILYCFMIQLRDAQLDINCFLTMLPFHSIERSVVYFVEAHVASFLGMINISYLEALI